MVTILRGVSDPRWGAAPPICSRVGLLTSAGSNRYGHCVRLTERWILTAHHVLDIPELAARFRAERFGFLLPGDKPGLSYALDPDAGFFCSEDGIQGSGGDGFDLDYAFVRLAGPFPEKDPSLAHALTASAGSPSVGSRAYVPQFNTFPWTSDALSCNDTQPLPDPNSTVPGYLQPVRVESPCYSADAMPNCGDSETPRGAKPSPGREPGTFAACEDPYLYHLAHTEEGCSGAPIFDADWQLVGVHTHGWRCENEDGNRKINNWGTRLSCIVKDAARRGFDFSEIPVLAPLVRA